MSEVVSDDTQVSVEQDGRTFTGVGVSESDLRDVMDAVDGESAATEQAAVSAAAPAQARAEDGKFARDTRGNKRFRELTAARDAEANRAAAAERERDEWRRKAESVPVAVSAAPAAAPVTPAEVKAGLEQPADRPKPTESEIGSKYEGYADFIEDLADWKAEQRLRASGLVSEKEFDARVRASLETDRASRDVAERAKQAFARGKAAFTDFETILQAPHMSVEWSGEKIAAIARLEAPEQIQYALGKDPILAERLRTADPVTFGMELARLITPARAVSSASAPPAVVTVPPPFQPVTGAGSSVVRSPLTSLNPATKTTIGLVSREKRAQERKSYRG